VDGLTDPKTSTESEKYIPNKAERLIEFVEAELPP
jgi:hypothetical protein